MLQPSIDRFVIARRLVVERGVAAVRIVPTFDEVEDCHPRLDLGFKPAALKQLAFQRGKETLAPRVIKTVAIDPIEGRTPASRRRLPKAIEVYWVRWSE